MSRRHQLSDGLSQGAKRVVIRELVFPPVARGEGGEPEPSDLQVTHEADEVTYELSPELTLSDAFALGMQAAQDEPAEVLTMPHFILPVADLTPDADVGFHPDEE